MVVRRDICNPFMQHPTPVHLFVFLMRFCCIFLQHMPAMSVVNPFSFFVYISLVVCVSIWTVYISAVCYMGCWAVFIFYSSTVGVEHLQLNCACTMIIRGYPILFYNQAKSYLKDLLWNHITFSRFFSSRSIVRLIQVMSSLLWISSLKWWVFFTQLSSI